MFNVTVLGLLNVPRMTALIAANINILSISRRCFSPWNRSLTHAHTPGRQPRHHPWTKLFWSKDMTRALPLLRTLLAKILPEVWLISCRSDCLGGTATACRLGDDCETLGWNDVNTSNVNWPSLLSIWPIVVICYIGILKLYSIS